MTTKNFITESIRFYSDDFILKGTLHLPYCGRPPIVIGLHGLCSSQDSPKQIALARACNQMGMAYLRFDHRGCGLSHGEFENVTSLASRCQDLKSAMELVKGWHKTGDCIGLFGSSIGGTVALSVAAEMRVDAIVTFAAPVRSEIGDWHHFPEKEPKNTSIYLDVNKSKFDITERIFRNDNILVLHGDADETVPVFYAHEIYRLAGEPKKLIIQQNGDHRMSDKNHQDEFLREASRWFKAGLAGD